MQKLVLEDQGLFTDWIDFIGLFCGLCLGVRFYFACFRCLLSLSLVRETLRLMEGYLCGDFLWEKDRWLSFFEHASTATDVRDLASHVTR